MRISDWSSDVCSSDLLVIAGAVHDLHRRLGKTDHTRGADRVGRENTARGIDRELAADRGFAGLGQLPALAFLRETEVRSEERRVGKECVSKCRSRWWQYTLKKKILKRIYKDTK